jgi:hypothetical protein
MEEMAIRPASNGTCHQHQDRQGARPNCAADLFAPTRWLIRWQLFC